MLTLCNPWRRSAMWPLSVRIMRGSEHTRWSCHLLVPLQGNLPDWWQECMFWIDPYKGSILKIHVFFGLFFYHGNYTVNKSNFEDFLKILKKYNISKVKSTGKKQNKKSCVVFTIRASVRLVPSWMFDYPDVDSENWKFL